MPRRRTTLTCLLVGAFATACTSSPSSSSASGAARTTAGPAVDATPAVAATPAAPTGAGSPSTGESPSTGASPSAPVSPSPVSPSPASPAGDGKAVAQRVHADELGQVPVLMYHQIIAKPGTNRYDNTPANFLAELTRLQKDNYVPVTAADYVAGTIDIPAGKHPVVLTFDDATNSQFELGPDGRPVPECAVGILQAFAVANPDFPATATFFVNNGPFSKTPHPLEWLHANGFEVAVHTVSHADLGQLTDAQAQKEIGDNFQMIAAAIGEAPTTFALPFGVHPKNHALASAGSSGGKPYSIAGVFLVGSNPAHSPYAKTFKADDVPRIRSQHLPTGADVPYESYAELGVLEAHPDRLFTSDGDAATLSYPKASAQYLGTVPAGMTTNAY